MKVQAIIIALLIASIYTAGCKIKRTAPTYKQCNSAWGSKVMATKSVCRVGCLMSSVAAGMASAGKKINGQTATPGSLHDFLKRNGGYSGNLFVWGAVSRFGLSYQGQPSSSATIKSAICANRIVILNVNGGGHWVLATGYDGNTYSVMDPGYSRSSYTTSQVVRAGIYTV